MRKIRPRIHVYYLMRVKGKAASGLFGGQSISASPGGQDLARYLITSGSTGARTVGTVAVSGGISVGSSILSVEQFDRT
jgi:hypothetical protein